MIRLIETRLKTHPTTKFVVVAVVGWRGRKGIVRKNKNNH